jgi:hypothetical protein
MKNHILTIILFLPFCIFSQNVSEINKFINISDSLQCEKEIRIYRSYYDSIHEVFRFFENEKKEWNITLYKYEIDKKGKSNNLQTIKLTSKNELDLVWLNFIQTKIQFLPDLNEVSYKLKSYRIDKVNGKHEIYTLGVSSLEPYQFTAYFKNGNIINKFSFGSYTSYLNMFPNVDELNSYAEIIDLIKKEFNIWK